MILKTKTIEVKSKKGFDVIDITDKIAECVRESGAEEGNVTVFVKGSTASVSAIEYEPNLVRDMERILERMVPSGEEYEHHKTWGDYNGHSHIRATLMGPSVTVPFKNKELLLGTWQQIVVLDFDVPARKREVVIQILGNRASRE